MLLNDRDSIYDVVASEMKNALISDLDTIRLAKILPPLRQNSFGGVTVINNWPQSLNWVLKNKHDTLCRFLPLEGFTR